MTTISTIAELEALSSPGQILAATSRQRIDGETYDAEWPERARKTMW